jgi:hypothetical protein
MRAPEGVIIVSLGTNMENFGEGYGPESAPLDAQLVMPEDVKVHDAEDAVIDTSMANAARRVAYAKRDLNCFSNAALYELFRPVKK